MAAKLFAVFIVLAVSASQVEAACDLGVLGGCIFGCPSFTNQTEQCEFLDCFFVCFDNQPDCKTDPTQQGGYEAQVNIYAFGCFNAATGCNALGLDTCRNQCEAAFNFSVPEEQCPLIECALSCYEDDFPACITDPFKAPDYQFGKSLEPFCTAAPTRAVTPAPTSGTPAPTPEPTTGEPTSSPVTPEPTTPVPTGSPVTPVPSTSPTTSSPSVQPSFQPTRAPNGASRAGGGSQKVALALVIALVATYS